MKINWKIRFRKKSFITAFFSAIMLLVQQISHILGYDITGISTEITSIFNTVLGLLVLLGVVLDPTVQGLGDSELSLSKDEPSSTSIEDLKNIVEEHKNTNNKESEVVTGGDK